MSMTEMVLREMHPEEICELARYANSFDSSFDNTPLVWYSRSDLLDLYYGEEATLLDILFKSPEVNLQDDYFWFAEDGTIKSFSDFSDIDMNLYIEDVVDYLQEQAGYAGFPDFCPQDLKEAVAEDMDMEVEDV